MHPVTKIILTVLATPVAIGVFLVISGIITVYAVLTAPLKIYHDLGSRK